MSQPTKPQHPSSQPQPPKPATKPAAAPGTTKGGATPAPIQPQTGAKTGKP